MVDSYYIYIHDIVLFIQERCTILPDQCVTEQAILFNCSYFFDDEHRLKVCEKLFGDIAALLLYYTSTLYDTKKIIQSDEQLPASAKQMDASVVIDVSYWRDLLNDCDNPDQLYFMKKNRIYFVVEMLLMKGMVLLSFNYLVRIFNLMMKPGC